MSTYRVEWPCGEVTETEAWEPSECPICALECLIAELTKRLNGSV